MTKPFGRDPLVVSIQQWQGTVHVERVENPVLDWTHADWPNWVPPWFSQIISERLTIASITASKDTGSVPVSIEADQYRYNDGPSHLPDCSRLWRDRQPCRHPGRWRCSRNIDNGILARKRIRVESSRGVAAVPLRLIKTTPLSAISGFRGWWTHWIPRFCRMSRKGDDPFLTTLRQAGII